jgi:hypothetical protein
MSAATVPSAPMSPAPAPAGEGMVRSEASGVSSTAGPSYGAFFGLDCEYALGDTPEHRGLGTWSDGVPVLELGIFDAKP